MDLLKRPTMPPLPTVVDIPLVPDCDNQDAQLKRVFIAFREKRSVCKWDQAWTMRSF